MALAEPAECAPCQEDECPDCGRPWGDKTPYHGMAHPDHPPALRAHHARIDLLKAELGDARGRIEEQRGVIRGLRDDVRASEGERERLEKRIRDLLTDLSQARIEANEARQANRIGGASDAHH